LLGGGRLTQDGQGAVGDRSGHEPEQLCPCVGWALLDELPAITPKLLTQRLRQLERDGLVVRTYHPEVPPRVEYQTAKNIHAPAEKTVPDQIGDAQLAPFSGR
jgi:hypothetical protein